MDAPSHGSGSPRAGRWAALGLGAIGAGLVLNVSAVLASAGVVRPGHGDRPIAIADGASAP